MLENIPKISVLMITYNQEDKIKRAINSLLFQKEYIYEICVSDDCSKDHTWDILQEFSANYPNLFKLHRNDPNIGIFENVEMSNSMPTGDLIYRLAGDDEAGDGYLKSIIGFIEEKKINWRDELFCIYGDYKEVEPSGIAIVYSNKMAPFHDALKLKIRSLISNRSACYSKKVLEKFVKVSEGRSYSAESSQDVQLALFSEKNYYIPIVGNIYYAGIGVSTRMSKDDRQQHLHVGFKKVTEFVASQGHPFDKKDLAYIEYFKAYRLGNIKKALKYYFKSIDLSLGFKGLQLNRIFYVVNKKIRH